MSINNRWFQLCASLIAMIMIANLQYAWTLFVNPLQAGTGWKLSRHPGRLHALHPFSDLGAADRRLADRSARPARIHHGGGRPLRLGWAGMGYATSLPMLTRSTALAGTGAAFVYSGSIGSALKWFKEKRGLAAGIMAAGFGGGTALFIPFIQWMIATNGYQRTFLVTGIFQGRRDRHRRAVPAASTGGAGCGCGGGPDGGQGGSRKTSVHDARGAEHAAVLRDVRDVRADGDGRPAGDGERRADGQVVGPLDRWC